MTQTNYYGNPVRDPYIFQGDEGICAIRSEGYVLACYGHEKPISDLVQEATDKGWYDPEQGTTGDNLHQLLQSNGVPCHTYSGVSILQMKDALDQGRMIIAGVDANEIYNPDSILEHAKDFVGCKTPNHALVVKDIDLEHKTVTLVDSAPGDANEVVSIKTFTDAFDDSHNLCVITDYPAPYQYDGNGVLIPSQASIDAFVQENTIHMSDDSMIFAATADSALPSLYDYDDDEDEDNDDDADDNDILYV